MATRSNIGVLNPDGTVTGIYCHNDGYPEHHGPILTRCYTTEIKVRRLLALGALSSLGRSIGEKHPFDRACIDFKGQCNAYHRDRDEAGPRILTWPSVDDYAKRNEGYAYLFTPGATWQVNMGKGWISIAEALAERVE